MQRLVPGRVEKRVRDIRLRSTALRNKWRTKKRIGNAVADAKRRLRHELLEHKLLNGIVKESPTHADGGLVGAACELRERAVFPAGAPVQAEAWGESFIVGVDKPTWDTLISGNDQACRRYSLVAPGISQTKQIARGT